jgi:hypothetical protein
MRLLGVALSGEGRQAEAEPLVIRGYEGMKAHEAQIPAWGQSHFLSAQKHLVQF